MSRFQNFVADAANLFLLRTVFGNRALRGFDWWINSVAKILNFFSFSECNGRGAPKKAESGGNAAPTTFCFMFKHSNPCREGFFPKKGLKKIYFSGSHILLPFEKTKNEQHVVHFWFLPVLRFCNRRSAVFPCWVDSQAWPDNAGGERKKELRLDFAEAQLTRTNRGRWTIHFVKVIKTISSELRAAGFTLRIVFVSKVEATSRRRSTRGAGIR